MKHLPESRPNRLSTYKTPRGYAHQMTDKVTPFIQTICQTDRFGGRCVRLDQGAWEVLDVYQWTEDQTAALQNRFPSLSVKIAANRKSLSGFSVLLHVQSVSHAWSSLLMCAVIVATNAAVARAIALNL